MTEETEALEADVVEIEAPDETDADPGELSPEDRASRRGWRPLTDYKGDPARWVDAETFLKREEESPALMRKSLQAAERKIANLERTLNRFADHHSKTEQRALERARKELQAQLANAAEQGDARTVQQITDEIVDLEKSATPAAAGQPDGLDEALQEFKAANSWWEKDKAMTGAAREIAQELADSGITDYRVQLREVAKRIREEFPHKFTNPRRKEPGAVEADTSPPKSRGKGYSDLPPEAKAICDDFVKRGVLTKERYVKEFFA